MPDFLCYPVYYINVRVAVSLGVLSVKQGTTLYCITCVLRLQLHPTRGPFLYATRYAGIYYLFLLCRDRSSRLPPPVLPESSCPVMAL